LNPKKEARIVYDDPKYWVVLPNTGLKEYKNVWMPAKKPVKKPTEEPKWVFLSLEQEKELREEIEATWDENYVLKAELKKIREGDDAKINDLRLAMRKLEAQAKADADEIYSLEIELSENMMKVRELEDQLALVAERNVMLREKVVELSSLDAKDKNCHELYLGLTYTDLMAKPEEERDEYWVV